MNKVTSLFGFGGTVNIDIILDPTQRKKFWSCKGSDGKRVKLPIYIGEEDISGVVALQLQDTKKFEHLGVKIDLIGHLEIYSDKNLSTDFMAMSKQLEPAGTLTQNKSFPFKFSRFQKQYQSFKGVAGQVRYFLRVTINRNYSTKLAKQIDFAVQIPNPQLQKDNNVPIKMEVGIEDCLHIEFTYNQTHYHLKDCLQGRVSFQLVKIKIKSMQLSVVRKQTFGNQNAQSKTESETLIKYEVMDGCPVKGEIIPIRMYMIGVDLTPTYKNVNNRLEVKHFLNLVLIDEEDRKYFKSHEIVVYRKK